MRLILFCLLLFAFPAEAVETFFFTDASGNSVRLYNEPCRLPAKIEGEEWVSVWVNNLRKAQMRWQGKDFLACWVRVGNSIVIIDSNQDVTPLPIQAFVKDQGV